MDSPVHHEMRLEEIQMADGEGKVLGKSEEKLKEEIVQYVNRRFDELQEKNREMLNQFHIEIIRQFEIQRHRIDAIIAEYALEDINLDEPKEVDQEYVIHVSQKATPLGLDDDEDEFSGYLLEQSAEDIND